MYTGFLIFLGLHATIHLTGFARAFGWLKSVDMKFVVTRKAGWFWLFASCCFVPVMVLFALNNSSWWITALMAVIISQWLIILYWKDARFGTIANIIIMIAAIIGYSQQRFNKSFTNEVSQNFREVSDTEVSLLTEADLVHLPEPIRQYLRYAGAVGKPKVKNFCVEFEGEIRSDSTSEWMPFTSLQYNFMEPPTRYFFMKAKMYHLPVHGYHRFSPQQVSMDIRLLSLFQVQYLEGSEMKIAETVTFFNDMCCMAPATLIDKRITWLESDSGKVKAEFMNDGIKVQAWLYFSKDGALVNFVSDDRFAAGDDGSMRRVPWSTPLGKYRMIGAQRLAGEAKTIYQYPEGYFTYGRFRTIRVLTNISAFEP